MKIVANLIFTAAIASLGPVTRTIALPEEQIGGIPGLVAGELIGDGKSINGVYRAVPVQQPDGSLVIKSRVSLTETVPFLPPNYVHDLPDEHCSGLAASIASSLLGEGIEADATLEIKAVLA